MRLINSSSIYLRACGAEANVCGLG
jgi:hypothetical protein